MDQRVPRGRLFISMLTLRRPGSPERKRWNTNSKWDRASSICRTKSAASQPESPLSVPRPNLLPDHERSTRTEVFRPRDGCQVVKELDLPPARLGNVIQVPPSTGGRSIGPGHNREHTTLGE